MYTNLDVGKWVSQQNYKQKYNSIYNYSTNVQSQQNNNGKRCTWVSDENHCMYTITVFAGCTVILITFPSAPLLVVIFVDSVYLYCYCRCYCILVCHFVDWLIFPPQVDVPFFFSACSSFTQHAQGTLWYQVSDPWCVYVSSSVGFTIYLLNCCEVKLLWSTLLLKKCLPVHYNQHLWYSFYPCLWNFFFYPLIFILNAFLSSFFPTFHHGFSVL